MWQSNLAQALEDAERLTYFECEAKMEEVKRSFAQQASRLEHWRLNCDHGCAEG